MASMSLAPSGITGDLARDTARYCTRSPVGRVQKMCPGSIYQTSEIRIEARRPAPGLPARRSPRSPAAPRRSVGTRPLNCCKRSVVGAGRHEYGRAGRFRPCRRRRLANCRVFPRMGAIRRFRICGCFADVAGARNRKWRAPGRAKASPAAPVPWPITGTAVRGAPDQLPQAPACRFSSLGTLYD